MKYYYLLLVILSLSACSQKADKKAVESIDPKNLISCEGIGQVRLTDTYADLQRKFGDSALSEHENTKAGNFTTIWEKNPKQLNVFWKEKRQPFKTIKYIEVIDRLSPYMTKDSIALGISLRDLVRKNGGMALTFLNFTSDRPGLITGYNNGELPKMDPCFEGVLEWTGQRPIDINELRTFQKMKEVKSFEMILQRMDIELGTIRVSAKK